MHRSVLQCGSRQLRRHQLQQVEEAAARRSAERTRSRQGLDLAAAEEERARFLEVAAQHPELRGIHDFRTRRAGAHDFAQFHMYVARDMTVADAHVVMDAVEDKIRAVFPKVEVLIHLDPEGHVDTDNPLIEADVTPHWFGKRL